MYAICKSELPVAFAYFIVSKLSFLIHSLSVPAKITTFEVQQKDSRSVIVRWFPNRLVNSPPIVSFALTYKKISDVEYNKIVIKAFKRSYIVKELQPLGVYEFKIQAVNRLGNGPPSDPKLIKIAEIAEEIRGMLFYVLCSCINTLS